MPVRLLIQPLPTTPAYRRAGLARVETRAKPSKKSCPRSHPMRLPAPRLGSSRNQECPLRLPHPPTRDRRRTANAPNAADTAISPAGSGTTATKASRLPLRDPSPTIALPLALTPVAKFRFVHPPAAGLTPLASSTSHSRCIPPPLVQ